MNEVTGRYTGVKINENCGIYAIINAFNGKMYIGSSSNIDRRFYLHLWDLRKNKHYNRMLQYAFNKYGEDFFVVISLESCSKEELLNIEQQWLDECKHDRFLCYNINFISERPPSWEGHTHSQETKNKIGDASRGRKLTPEMKKRIKDSWIIRRKTPISELTRKRLSIATSGKNNPMYGRTFFEAWKQKYGIEEANKKMVLWKKSHDEAAVCLRGDLNPAKRPEVRKKISMKSKGRRHTMETRLKISLSKKGKKLSEKTRMLFSAMRKGENNSASKLSNKDRQDIKDFLISGVNATLLAKKYNVSRRTIYNARDFQ